MKKIINLAAQGPDIFYHNQRTTPTAFRFGRLLHRSRYGSVLAALVRHAHELRGQAFEEAAGYILGFATHAVLDRITHPYIVAFAGGCYQCHPFFERILDVCMIKELRDAEIGRIDLPSWFPAEGLPESVRNLLIRALNEVYAGAGQPLLPEELGNAVYDALNFYRWTNPAVAETARVLAFKHDRDENGGRRRLALFHPLEDLPELDYLNKEHKTWHRPFIQGAVSSESFIDLYGKALDKGRIVLETVCACLEGKKDAEALETVLGNGNLNGKIDIPVDGPVLSRKDTGLVHRGPEEHFPLSGILDRMYERMAEVHPEL
ncbi:MAG: hypothetical protein E4H36_00390 [Spirochaetales bacterium]|nr:MAG: hypothetical protein E4H36_00390 [Spirochaetales bacterium]